MMRTIWGLVAMTLVSGAVAPVARAEGGTLVVTSSNAPSNRLLVYDAQGVLLASLPTGGQGGVGGNAGGIATAGGAVGGAHFGAGGVSIFRMQRARPGLSPIGAPQSAPACVALGEE